MTDSVGPSDEAPRGGDGSDTTAAQALREDGTFDAVISEFERSPSAELSVPMLVRGPGWADDATDAFVSLS